MRSPFNGGEITLVKEPRVLEFRGSKFDIVHHHYLCNDTGEAFTDTQLDDLNLNQVYNQYRVQEGIPFLDEIIAYRKQYDIPATKFSQILGFGVNMYGKYESGEMPNLSNGRMINICKDPVIFRNYFKNAVSHRLPEKERDSIQKKIERAIENKRVEFDSELERLAALGNTERGIYTGYVIPNLQKSKQMLVFFANKCQPFVTKMNKLLFYADFFHFNRTGYSISGISYQAITNGPVPHKYDALYGSAADVVEKEDVFFEKGDIVGEKLITNTAFDASLFQMEELETLNKVAERFSAKTTKEIVDISHIETAWLVNESDRNIISYQLAFDLKAMDW